MIILQRSMLMQYKSPCSIQPMVLSISHTTWSKQSLLSSGSITHLSIYSHPAITIPSPSHHDHINLLVHSVQCPSTIGSDWPKPRTHMRGIPSASPTAPLIGLCSSIRISIFNRENISSQSRPATEVTLLRRIFRCAFGCLWANELLFSCAMLNVRLFLRTSRNY